RLGQYAVYCHLVPDWQPARDGLRGLAEGYSMTDENTFHIPDIPAPQHWHNAPRSWNWSADNQLTIEAGERTDWFIDPQGAVETGNAPALLFSVHEPAMLTAKVSVHFASTYDAGALVVHHAPNVWGKLAL